MNSRKKSIYSIHPSFNMEAGYRKNIIERTGKTLEAWAEITQKSGPTELKACREWLKKKHGFTPNYAYLIVEYASGNRGANSYHPEKLVENMYSGKKAILLPIYEKLLELGFNLGSDVKACPAKTIVPLYRNHVFAQIKPTTQTRIDLGLALKDTPAVGCLIDTGGFAKKDRITHRIPIASEGDISSEVKKWLKTAYKLDADR